MSEHFEVGEIAYHVVFGCRVTITEAIRLRPMKNMLTGQVGFAPAYAIDRHDGEPTPFGPTWLSLPQSLRKLPKSGDKRDVGNWDECPWQPEREQMQ